MISDPQFIQIALSAGATEQLIADLRARQMQFAGAGQMVSLFDIARQGVLTQEQVVQFLQLAGARAQAPAPQAPAPQTSIAPAPTPAAPAPQARPVSPGPPEQGESDPPPRTSRIPKKRKARRAPRREQGLPAPALAAIGGGGVLLLLILFSLLSSGPDQTERGSPPRPRSLSAIATSRAAAARRAARWKRRPPRARASPHTSSLPRPPKTSTLRAARLRPQNVTPSRVGPAISTHHHHPPRPSGTQQTSPPPTPQFRSPLLSPDETSHRRPTRSTSRPSRSSWT